MHVFSLAMAEAKLTQWIPSTKQTSQVFVVLLSLCLSSQHMTPLSQQMSFSTFVMVSLFQGGKGSVVRMLTELKKAHPSEAGRRPSG